MLRGGGQREPPLALTEQDARPGQKSRVSDGVVTSPGWQSHFGVGRASLKYRSLNVVFIFQGKREAVVSGWESRGASVLLASLFLLLRSSFCALRFQRRAIVQFWKRPGICRGSWAILLPV